MDSKEGPQSSEETKEKKKIPSPTKPNNGQNSPTHSAGLPTPSNSNERVVPSKEREPPHGTNEEKLAASLSRKLLKPRGSPEELNDEESAASGAFPSRKLLKPRGHPEEGNEKESEALDASPSKNLCQRREPPEKQNENESEASPSEINRPKSPEGRASAGGELYNRRKSPEEQNGKTSADASLSGKLVKSRKSPDVNAAGIEKKRRGTR